MKSSLWSLILVCALLSSSVLADRVRNGGHFSELEFTALAYDLHDALVSARRQGDLVVPMDLQRFKRVISRATFRVVGFLPMIDGKPRHAVNVPDLLLVEFNGAQFGDASLKARYEMVLHELLPLIDVDDTGYHRSIAQVRQLDKLGLLTQKKAAPTVAPVLLGTVNDDDKKEGMTLESARNLCGRAKEINSETYFVVYCHFIAKTWKERYEYHRRENTHEHWIAKSSREIPWSEVHRHLKSRIDKSGLENVTTYGVRIYGLGLSATLPWRVLVDSQNFGDGFGARLFKSRVAATEACRNLVYKLDAGSLRFYRASCRTALNPETGLYSYEVITQNPMVESTVKQEIQ